MDSVVLVPGMLVAGKYELKRPLARGAMGEVWVASHATLGGELAIKFLSRGPSHDGEDEATAMARFRFEAQVAAKLARKTRHIASVTDHGEEYGYAYLVMELVSGESLEALMRRSQHMDLQTLAPIVSQIAKGLAQAHAEGVFHRDLKPANILLSHDEDGGLLVKLLDFGIAKTVRSHKVTGAHEPGHSTEIGIVLGTPNYMSPEQARGLANLDHRCDLWALSTIAYEALCNALPYDGETTADLLVNICSVDPVPPRTHRPDLPPSADAFFHRAFAASVKNRYQTASELAAAFAAVVADHPSAARAAVATLPQPKLELVEEHSASSRGAAVVAPPRRKLGLYVFAGAAAVVLLIVLGAVFSRSRAPSPAAAGSTTVDEPPSVTSAPTVASAPPPPASAEPSVVAPPLPNKPTGVTAKVKPGPHAPSAAPSAPPAPTHTSKPIDKGEIL